MIFQKCCIDDIPSLQKDYPKNTVRLGIVSTMRDPLDIHIWSNHHCVLSVKHFFITVNRTPWLMTVSVKLTG
jgi:hypothetical protein